MKSINRVEFQPRCLIDTEDEEEPIYIYMFVCLTPQPHSPISMCSLKKAPFMKAMLSLLIAEPKRV